MAASSGVEVKVNLAFPKAGVVFVIEVQGPQGAADGKGPSFQLRVNSSSSGRSTSFDAAKSPQLADWARGYSRWLVRANVTASYDRDGITGAFAAGLTPEQVLGGLRDACEMIRQRFALYQEKIVA